MASCGTAIAAAVLCSFFTAFTGGSGVTILALGGLLLPPLTKAGFPEQRGISLVTSASALGVLLAPSVPLIMYAIIARVPINTMFLAGVLPAVVMVVFLLLAGGYLRRGKLAVPAATQPHDFAAVWPALKAAKWNCWRRRWPSARWSAASPRRPKGRADRGLRLADAGPGPPRTGLAALRALVDCAEVIGGIMVILGMALGLTNYLVDAGIPDQAIDWVQSVLPNKFAFLVALNLFLLLAGALMEIYAAIVVLVPLLLPVALSYGIDPVHFGVIFLANIEMGFLCPPAGMNIYFASAMFGKSIRYVAVSVLPAVLAMLLGR
jgi:TRAP-type C4-dicarboxylate transport system permease large subunit